jgi:Flp pilus assembly protein TadD
MANVRNKYGAPRQVLQARSAIAAKRWDEAARLLTPVVERHAEIDAVVLLAGTEVERGRPHRAIELLGQLLHDRGNFPVAMLLLGDAYRAAGDDEQARHWWEATAASRSSAGLHERLAASYEKLGRADDARRERARALEATGVAQLRHANPAAAERSFESAVAIESALPRSWFYLGECRRLLGNAAGARDAYGKTLELAPNHGRAIAALESLPK